MIQQIGHKLRRQIHRFSGELCTRMGKVSLRFVEETIFGLSANGSVRLTEIARSLEEDIPLHATHKRLSRNLGNKTLASHIEKKVLQLGAKRITQKTCLLLTRLICRKSTPERCNRKVLWWAVEAYITRWRVEETIRFIKQSYDIEDIRVLTYDRLRNMAVLVLAASYLPQSGWGLRQS